METAGSSPAWPAKYIQDVAQFGRAPFLVSRPMEIHSNYNVALGAGGCWFESSRPDKTQNKGLFLQSLLIQDLWNKKDSPVTNKCNL